MAWAQRLTWLRHLSSHHAHTGVRVALDDADEVATRPGPAFVDVESGPDGGPYRCPCCAAVTLPERGAYELCPVCFWEDDGQDEHDSDQVRGGPNGPLSLDEARANYAEFGASDRAFLDHVRRPDRQERPE